MDDETDDEIITGEADDDQTINGEADDPEDDSLVLLSEIARNTATTKTLALAALVVLILGIAGLGALVVNRTGSTTVAATKGTTTTSSTVPAMESAAGKPCVATVDPLPAGAPPVDVVVGPPPTDLVIKDIKEGTGPAVTSTDTVTINYVGVACSTGKIFDSSYKTGTPATFPVAQVIPGFGKGVTGMKVGGQRLIAIPSDQAYGPSGSPPTIAPDEALWFVVELTAIKPG
ncbi:MAG TPA: FKBP-type peptidyl-prolyl cis-trans isomerase [Acidimicrobiales bacterium]